MTTITVSFPLPQLKTLIYSPFNPIPINCPSKLKPNLQLKTISPFPRLTRLHSSSSSRNSLGDEGSSDSTGSVEILRVPDHWFQPSTALQESEWLRVALQKWLDEEYCPEPTNVDISRVAAQSYYHSLVQKTADLSDILLRMISQLQLLSYQESFHGPFSSANAAIALIAQKLDQL